MLSAQHKHFYSEILHVHHSTLQQPGRSTGLRTQYQSVSFSFWLTQEATVARCYKLEVLYEDRDAVKRHPCGCCNWMSFFYTRSTNNHEGFLSRWKKCSCFTLDCICKSRCTVDALLPFNTHADLPNELESFASVILKAVFNLKLLWWDLFRWM